MENSEEEVEECGAGFAEDTGHHECWEPKGHEGAHRCVACSEQW